MKKWVVEIKGVSHVCDLQAAFTVASKLLMDIGGKRFMVCFDSKNDYYDAINGFRRPVTITNMSKTQYKHGFAVFRIPKS